jgi:predicted AlkP superfamily pyrophosphatase or phosphodiesterase
MKEGVRAASMKASVPTVTWPNHTTLVTGVHPARHGVVGNNFYDRATHKRMVLISDPVFDKDEIVKVPTIYDVAKAAGLKTAAVRWPATRNAKSLDWRISDVSSIELLKTSTTASLVAESKADGLWAEVDAAEKTEKDGRWLPSDEMCTKVFNLILTRHRPNLALLHLIDVDHTEHIAGPQSPEAYAAIKESDTFVREVWDTLKAQFPGRATLIVVSDHGFSPIRRQVLPNVVLRKAKLLNDADETSDDKDSQPAVRVVPQGGCAMIYVLDDARRTELCDKIRAAFDGLEGIAKVVGPDETPSYGVARPKDDPHAPDMLLFAEYGYAFGDTAAGDLPFNEKPERKGSHGHDPNLPELRASFVAWGAGIKKGVKLGDIENTAVTPTIAELLGLDMPGLDGKPLSAALVH